ncbi:ubiquitin carboxyl-terminal hydrolase [Anaeramoeba flamelloides]|uniref:Ubiquitin carboxyl-terminal hydrolase n=1 Tax=Anaeramoeba flamelloides TaxID=1746091 RepID=A0ABQ8Y4K1_9EUKA|nr:ubiquitin carboxyl-terminal hydrolase [Anaeramoeba flamelloides]
MSYSDTTLTFLIHYEEFLGHIKEDYNPSAQLSIFKNELDLIRSKKMDLRQELYFVNNLFPKVAYIITYRSNIPPNFAEQTNQFLILSLDYIREKLHEENTQLLASLSKIFDCKKNGFYQTQSKLGIKIDQKDSLTILNSKTKNIYYFHKKNIDHFYNIGGFHTLLEHLCSTNHQIDSNKTYSFLEPIKKISTLFKIEFINEIIPSLEHLKLKILSLKQEQLREQKLKSFLNISDLIYDIEKNGDLLVANKLRIKFILEISLKYLTFKYLEMRISGIENLSKIYQSQLNRMNTNSVFEKQNSWLTPERLAKWSKKKSLFKLLFYHSRNSQILSHSFIIFQFLLKNNSIQKEEINLFWNTSQDHPTISEIIFQFMIKLFSDFPINLQKYFLEKKIKTIQEWDFRKIIFLGEFTKSILQDLNENEKYEEYFNELLNLHWNLIHNNNLEYAFSTQLMKNMKQFFKHENFNNELRNSIYMAFLNTLGKKKEILFLMPLLINLLNCFPKENKQKHNDLNDNERILKEIIKELAEDHQIMEKIIQNLILIKERHFKYLQENSLKIEDLLKTNKQEKILLYNKISYYEYLKLLFEFLNYSKKINSQLFLTTKEYKILFNSLCKNPILPIEINLFYDWIITIKPNSNIILEIKINLLKKLFKKLIIKLIKNDQIQYNNDYNCDNNINKYNNNNNDSDNNVENYDSKSTNKYNNKYNNNDNDNSTDQTKNKSFLNFFLRNLINLISLIEKNHDDENLNSKQYFNLFDEILKINYLNKKPINLNNFSFFLKKKIERDKTIEINKLNTQPKLIGYLKLFNIMVQNQKQYSKNCKQLINILFLGLFKIENNTNLNNNKHTNNSNSNSSTDIVANTYNRDDYNTELTINLGARFKHKKTRKTVYQLLVQLINYTDEYLNQISELFLKKLKIIKPPNSWNYSLKYELKKKPTDYLGLKNLGSTCFLNSLIQQFFMIPKLRKKIVNLNIEPNNENIVYQLQLLFAHLLEDEKKYIDTRNFCKTFKDYNNKPLNVTKQMDVYEFLTMFWSHINNYNEPKELFKKFFEGKFLNEIIESKSNQTISQKVENFFVLSLEVKNKLNLQDSLDQYFQSEFLTGENQFYSGQLKKKVDAIKKTYVNSLPNYLILHLKRFEWDYNLMKRFKINTKFKFPQKLNFSKYFKLNAVNNQDYTLNGIIVHWGTSESGHYYSLIKDDIGGVDNENDQDHEVENDIGFSEKKILRERWYRFDDTNVSEFNPEKIPEECYGGSNQINNSLEKNFVEKNYSAYMLIYKKNEKMENNYHPELSRSITQSTPNKNQIINQIWKNNSIFLFNKYFYEKQFFQFLNNLIKSNEDVKYNNWFLLYNLKWLKNKFLKNNNFKTKFQIVNILNNFLKAKKNVDNGNDNGNDNDNGNNNNNDNDKNIDNNNNNNNNNNKINKELMINIFNDWILLILNFIKIIIKNSIYQITKFIISAIITKMNMRYITMGLV